MRVAQFLIVLLVVAVTVFNVVMYVWRARVLGGLTPCEEVDQLGWLDIAWCFGEECLATALMVVAAPAGWLIGRQPARTQNTEHGAQIESRGPVVLVHGWGLNGGSMLWLRRRLLRDGWGPVSCFNYLSRQANVEKAAADLATYLGRVEALSAQPITLVGHSLGGLVIRYYARHYPATSVRRIVTLGTPHHGTVVAQRWLDKLAPRSPLILELNRGDRTPKQFDVITIYSTFDAIVLPPANAAYPGAFNVQLNNIGHNALLTSARVYELIAENLAAPLQSAARTTSAIAKTDGFVGWTG